MWIMGKIRSFRLLWPKISQDKENMLDIETIQAIDKRPIIKATEVTESMLIMEAMESDIIQVIKAMQI